jgi:hypothetical protein
MRIASKGSNIPFDPLKGKALVEEAGVGRRQFIMGHESKRSQTITDIDSDEVLALAYPITKVVIRRSTVLQATPLVEERCSY